MAITFQIDGSVPWQSFEVILEVVQYTIELRWNTRDSRWYLALYDATASEIFHGIACVADYPLARRCADARMPPGRLMMLDTSGAGDEIAQMTDLGTRHSLVYVPSDEVAGLA